MKSELADIVDNSCKHIMMVMQGDDGELCAYYLRTSYQKCLFAEQRYKSLIGLVHEYKRRLDRREILDSLLLAMDYDHFLVSLRSALENLAKFIGYTLPSNLPKATIAYKGYANLGEIAYVLKNNLELSENPYMMKLSTFISKKIRQNWYKELVEPGLVISHDKFRPYPRVSPRDITQQLLDFRFLLPDTLEEAESGQGSIIIYCRNMMEEVEAVLEKSCMLVQDYLINR